MISPVRPAHFYKLLKFSVLFLAFLPFFVIIIQDVFSCSCLLFFPMFVDIISLFGPFLVLSLSLLFVTDISTVLLCSQSLLS